MENCTKQKFIDGELFEKLVINGALNLKANLKIVNDLNVFPIPDGDTGDNMYMTISGGINGLKAVKENSVCEKAKALANGMLLNARGNSGVILSQLFAGIAEGLKNHTTVSVQEFGTALKCGVCKAYASVAKPVEGTILTVAKDATDFACEKCGDNSTIGGFFVDYISEMRNSLDRTPELLEVLKEAGVIDSGGAGLVYIAEGMKQAVEGKSVVDGESYVGNSQSLDFSKFNENSIMKYGYCTELLLQLQTAKTNVNNFDINPLVSYLESVGDSVVAFLTGTIVKIHVHTLTPYKVLEYCQRYGEFLTVKIENMTLQHNGIEKKEEKKIKVSRPRKKFGVVTVATGEGLINTFKELGVDEVIDGGQGKNPSIERFIEVFDEVNADWIFVLPNNSNIIMSAKQASEMYGKSKIEVIETKNIGQAYSVISMLDFSSNDGEQIASQMRLDMQGVITGSVTKSIRDACIDGVDIKCGNYIGFEDKKMLTSLGNKVDTLTSLVDKLGAKDKNFMILSYGASVSDQEKIEASTLIKVKYPQIEFYEIDGKQEVYDFIVIIE